MDHAVQFVYRHTWKMPFSLCTDTHGPCCSVCVQTHMDNAVQFVYRHTCTMLFSLCTDTHGPCCSVCVHTHGPCRSVCVQTHMDHAVQFVYRHTWTMLFSLCTDTHGPCCSVHKQSAGLLRLNKADLHQFAFRYSPFLTKLNKHQRILLAILYVMLRSATFLILFSNLTSTSYDDEDNKKCMCARAHIPFS